MAYLCGSCKRTTVRKGGKRKGKRKGYRGPKSVRLEGAPVGTKTCKRAYAACKKRRAAKILPRIYPGTGNKAAFVKDAMQRAEVECRRVDRKVKKACKY